MTRHLVLAGAGHAHLDLLQALARNKPPGWTVTLVTPEPDFHYSGMLPGIIAGILSADAAQIPVAAIARAAGLQLRLASVTVLDPGRQQLTLHDGSALQFDLLSLDVGSAAAGRNVPGVLEHAFAMRPFGEALRLIAQLDRVLRSQQHVGPIPVVVVGAGAAGVEIALAMRARILAAGREPSVTLVDAMATDGSPLPGFTDASRRVGAEMLRRRGVRVLEGAVTEVRAEAVRVNVRGDIHQLPSLATAWVSGPAAHPWLAESGVECDAAGYPLVSDTLALDADESMFGGGDCVTLRSAPRTAKAGVYAVRMAPALAANVLSAARGDAARARFTPQHDFLALLSTGDGSALLRWRNVTVESRWAQWLKMRIDERYLRQYRTLAP